MNEKSQNGHIEELEDQPDAKLFSELFITEEDRDMYSIDFDTNFSQLGRRRRENKP